MGLLVFVFKENQEYLKQNSAKHLLLYEINLLIIVEILLSPVGLCVYRLETNVLSFTRPLCNFVAGGELLIISLS